VINSVVSEKLRRALLGKVAYNLNERVKIFEDDDVAAMEKYLVEDIAYGTAAKDQIAALKTAGKTQDLNNFIRMTFVKRINIDLSRSALVRKPEKAYDTIIIVSSTKEEADFKQKILDEAFAGLGVNIFSVYDSAAGGQI
ncbi:MAG: hypothetical protein HQL28_06055, partial [Candidatus Omnitrophica bacterium]|nr:hypothetical protein [Candidatus Omnitrophota bacterium]